MSYAINFGTCRTSPEIIDIAWPTISLGTSRIPISPEIFEIGLPVGTEDMPGAMRFVRRRNDPLGGDRSWLECRGDDLCGPPISFQVEWTPGGRRLVKKGRLVADSDQASEQERFPFKRAIPEEVQRFAHYLVPRTAATQRRSGQGPPPVSDEFLKGYLLRRDKAKREHPTRFRQQLVDEGVCSRISSRRYDKEARLRGFLTSD